MALTKVSQSMVEDNPFVNALDFGADNTGATDSTAAIQLALDTEKDVFLPKGEYKVSASLKLYKGQTLFGQNRYYKLDYEDTSTYITSDQSGGAYAVIDVDTNVARGFCLRNLVIRQDATNPTRLGYGLRVGTFSSGGSASTGHNALVDNCMFFLFQYGILFDGRAYDMRIQDCLFKTNYDAGIKINSGTNINACLFSNLTFEDIGSFSGTAGNGHGIDMEAGDISLINPRFNPVLGTGVLCDSGQVGIQGAYFENCGVSDIAVTGTGFVSVEKMSSKRGGGGTYTGTQYAAILVRGDGEFYGKGIRYTCAASNAVDGSGRSPALFAKDGNDAKLFAYGVYIDNIHDIGSTPQGRPYFFSPGSGDWRMPDIIETEIDNVPLTLIPNEPDNRTHVCVLNSGKQPTDITFTCNSANTNDYLVTDSTAPSKLTYWNGSAWTSYK